MATNTTQNSGGRPKMKFRAIESFDHKKLPADLPAGQFEVVLKSATPRVSNDGDNMVSIKFTVTEADDAAHEHLVGKTVDDVIMFYADDDEKHARSSKMSKIKMRQMCEAFDLELDIIPTSISEDGSELFTYCEALEGSKGTIWTTVRTNPDTQEERTNILYAKPGGGLKKVDEDEDEEEEEEEEERRPAKKTAKKSSGARR